MSRHPAYHLRPNKAADRFALIEAIKRLERLDANGLLNYTYYGMGGPYLEDFRLLYEHCSDIDMVSVEQDPETFKRQRFHLPCGNLQLVLDDLSSFIGKFDPQGRKSIFWLDYTDLAYSHLADLMALLQRVNEDSMIKITLRCHPSDYRPRDSRHRQDKVDAFLSAFKAVLPAQTDRVPMGRADFAALLQDMVRIASQQALPAFADSLRFIPVSSFYYADTVGIFTITGIVRDADRMEGVTSLFSGWEFANLSWAPPRQINIPTLSTKERLRLQRLLPSDGSVGTVLREELGYLIDKDHKETEAALQQYADFHRYSPYVLRGVP